MPSESKFKIISLLNVATFVRNMYLWEVEQCTCGLEPLVPLGAANQVRCGPATVVSGCLLQKSACLIWIFWIGTVQTRATSNCSTKSSCKLNFKFHILFIFFGFFLQLHTMSAITNRRLSSTNLQSGQRPMAACTRQSRTQENVHTESLWCHRTAGRFSAVQWCR